MGISNFRKLIDCFYLDNNTLNIEHVQPFDSILIDVQSMLYIAIEQSFAVHNEAKLFQDISSFVQREISRVMLEIFESLPMQNFNDTITVICSFDGQAVPMKWPVQSSRRKLADISGKNLYRVALFNNNIISARVRDDLIYNLTNSACSFHYKYFGYRTRLPKTIRYIISGCDVTGEGEHKIFEIAESVHVGCKRPIVVSIDNDAFILSFARLNRYESIQLYKGQKKHFYHLTHLVRNVIPFPIEMLVFVSFLFGNDFMQPIITITTNNHILIQDSLVSIYEENINNTEDDSKPIFSQDNHLNEWIQCLPDLYQQFLEKMLPRITFQSTPHIHFNVVYQFWITILWISDYYRNRYFPQKTIENKIMGLFDRNMIITALLDRDVARETFEDSFKMYTEIGENRNPNTSNAIIPHRNLESDAIQSVFDAATLNAVSRFLIKHDPENNECKNEGFCYDVKISTLTRKRKLPNVA